MAKLFEQFFEQFGQSLPMYFISMYYKHLHIQYTKTFLHYFSAFLVPLHSGYEEQLQNSLKKIGRHPPSDFYLNNLFSII